MVLTAEPRVNRRGLKGMLHSCKLSQGRLQACQCLICRRQQLLCQRS